MRGVQMNISDRTNQRLKKWYIDQHDHGAENAAGVHDRRSELEFGVRTSGRHIRVQIITHLPASTEGIWCWKRAPPSAILQQRTTTESWTRSKREQRQKDEVQKAKKMGWPRSGEFC